MFMIVNHLHLWHFLLVTSTTINHPLNLGSIEVLLRDNGYFGSRIFLLGKDKIFVKEKLFFCQKRKKDKSLIKNKKVLQKGKSLIIMKYRFCQKAKV